MDTPGFVPLGLLAILLAAQAVPAAQPAVPDRPLLTRISAIRALSQDESARGYPVHVTGTVTHFDERHGVDLVLHDGQLGQYVLPPADAAALRDWASIRIGDMVDVVGRTVRGGFAPNVSAERVRILGRGTLPSARVVPYAGMITGRHDCEYVEIEGIVQRVWRSSDPTSQTLFAEVAFGEGVVRALFWDFTPGDLTRLTDARVRLRGNLGTIFGPSEQLRGVSLFAGRTSDMTVLEPAPGPFAQPPRAISSIFHYSQAGEVPRRVRLRGVVTCYLPGHPVEVRDFTTGTRFRSVRHVFYMQDATGAARIETEQDTPVHPGDLVDVAGFPAISPGRPMLTNASLRVVGSDTQPAARPVAAQSALAAENDAELVRLDAQLVRELPGPEEQVLILKAGDSIFDVRLEATAGEPLPSIRPGSIVAVTGVYAFQGGPPPSFQLFLRSPRDLVLVAAAPWWTPLHSVVMGSALVLVGLVAAAWVNTSSSRKRHQYQAVLEERTRVARELHDTLEQVLVGITLQLEAVDATLQTTPDVARRSLDVARQMLRYSLEETHRSVMDLRSQALESRDLPGALTSLASQMTLATHVQASVRVHGTPRRLDAAQEHHLLRIGLEALTNSLKHAAPSRVDIDLQFEPDTVTLVASDDGRGIRRGESPGPGTHFGLQGLRERATKLGGVLTIDSEPGHGTRVRVTVPVHGAGRLNPAMETA